MAIPLPTATPTPAPQVVRPLRVRQAPQQGGANPQQGGANPQQGGANPQQGGANPQQGGANPQQGGANPQQGGANPPNAAPSSNANPNSQSNANPQSNSGSQGSSGSQSSSGSQASSGGSSRPPSTSVPNIPQTAPAGGILFTQPPQTAAASFYKIAQGQLVTFGWNLTSLIITPDALTVSAFCSDNGNTYPIGPTNGVIPGHATQVVWDPFSYQQANPTQPLIAGSYTLQIMDAHGLTQLPAPGRFAPNTQMTFGLYKPQDYTPLASWTCEACSSASSLTTNPLLLSIFITFLAMVLGGWGVFRRH